MRRKVIALILVIAFCSLCLGCSASSSEKPFTVGFLPLDTRPCCRDIPIELADIAGVKVISPPINHLTHFKEDADTQYVKKWLADNASSCNALVISMEQLLYGGLIQSRNGDLEPEAIDEVVEFLKSIKNDNPNTPIYLSNVLMRTYTSIFSEEDVIWWEKINEYSNAYYRSEILHDTAATSELRTLKEEIPSDVLERFLSVRAENLSLNLLCIDLVKDGVVDKLVIGQDDCSEVGIQTVEREELMEAIKENNLEDNVSIVNGTDETGAELIAHAINPDGCSVSVCWLGDNVNFTANYEDRKFQKNLNEHCSFMNISFVEDAENVICILVPKKCQGDYATGDFDNYEAYSAQELQNMCNKIKSLTDSHRHCYILDLNCANGGTPEFISCLGQTMDIRDIYGYSGWNTASNSLGTLLGHIISSEGNNTDLNCAYTAERILDEVVYQSIVRPSMYEQANELYEESGEKVNVYDMQNIEDKRNWLRSEFDLQEKLIKEIFGDNLPVYDLDFRWPRLFEISVKCDGFEPAK